MEKNALHVSYVVLFSSLLWDVFGLVPSFCGGSIQKGLFGQLHWENKAGLPA